MKSSLLKIKKVFEVIIIPPEKSSLITGVRL